MLGRILWRADRLGRQFRQFAKRRRVIAGGGARRCLIDEILGKEAVREVVIGGIETHVRSGTPDLEVAISSYCDKEYDHIVLDNPSVIVDAGANIGTSSVFFARKYPQARIIAVEPEAGNFALLTRNTEKYGNVTPVRAAIWGELGKKTIQDRFTGPWGYTITETSNAHRSTGQEVDCITISRLMADFGVDHIDLLKMDIEGSEKDVMERSQDWIDSVGTIAVELHDRICEGCDRAFYLATKDFRTFVKHGEKITAYRGSGAGRPSS